MPAFNFPDPPIVDGTEVTNPETGVTYRWDNAATRWVVVSTTGIDNVLQEITDLQQDINTINIDINQIGDDITDIEGNIDDINDQIDGELDNRDDLLAEALEKNNQQDAELAELDQRLDAISENIGILEFKGDFRYVLENSQAACDAAFAACMLAAGGDVPSQSECIRLHSECGSNVGQPLEAGTFTTLDTRGASGVEEIVISNTSLSGSTFDWLNLLTEGDYLEIYETVGLDTFLYEVVADTFPFGQDEKLRVKFIRQTGQGDGLFNIGETCEIRVFQKDLGLDLNEADKRYVSKPYTVMMGDTPPTTGNAEDGVLRNGELWYSTETLELFTWNNNAWTPTSIPGVSDGNNPYDLTVLTNAVDVNTAAIAALNAEVDTTEVEVDALQDAQTIDRTLLVEVEQKLNQAEQDINDIQNLDISNAVSALAQAQQDIIDLKSKVETLELTSFLILE